MAATFPAAPSAPSLPASLPRPQTWQRLLHRRLGWTSSPGRVAGTAVGQSGWEFHPIPPAAPGRDECFRDARFGFGAQTVSLDEADDQSLFDGVLQYIREHGKSLNFKITKAPDEEGVELSPGLGWHEVEWRGELQILVMERLSGTDVHRRLVIVVEPGRDVSIREFLELCRATAPERPPNPEDREEPRQQTPKFWVQELVEKAIREEEEAEQRQSPPDDWSKMDKEEANEKGAKRLGLDFDPLAPS
eukprot:s4250_g2.t2